MPPVTVNFVGPSYISRSPAISADRCINLVPEMVEVPRPGQADVAALVGTPGLLLFAQVDAPIRGLYASPTGFTYVAHGNKISEVQADGTIIPRGGLASSTGVVRFTDNGFSVVAVDGVSARYMNFGGAGFAPMVDPDFPADATHVDFLDGYIIFNFRGLGKFGWTGLYALTVDPLNFQQAEGSVDAINGLLVDHRELWLFGQESTEVYYNAGTTATFQRIAGAYIEHGSLPHTMAKLDNSVFWVEESPNGHRIVNRANGYQPERVSTHGVEYLLSQYTSMENAVGYAYHATGHAYYVLQCPTADTTWVYDASTRLWHERASMAGGVLGRHKAQFYCFAFGAVHLVGDWSEGNLYSLRDDVYTDNGAEIPAIRRFSVPVSNNLTMYDHSLTVPMQTGVGLDAGVEPGATPQAVLRWSNDGGHTWSNEHWAPIGPLGAYDTRVIWRRLGRRRHRVYEVKITDPVKRVFPGDAILDTEVGTA